MGPARYNNKNWRPFNKRVKKKCQEDNKSVGKGGTMTMKQTSQPRNQHQNSNSRWSSIM
ncbi:Uncharacterized protein BM_BM14432 [Brugia malayi]|uniref:Bm14432 n=1 Tax=Brugia malayi TaxID=6279 RepID=A0A0K0J149_BRUMA|nr:Uncharacterized protein BM_BM14432 [Brugia malayi]CDQ00848.1 Bm14432 [Brugia malayi]VIO86593.1 Uncharacterized protein BM_BM14432 [Brugia malayi]